MKKITLLLSIFLFNQIVLSQIVINELDVDTSGVDTLELIELKSDTPNFSLDGYIVVLFNGSASGMDSSYFTIDLMGLTTDINGLLLIGSASVVPFPQHLMPVSIIQNGADAIGVYQASLSDFPDGTLATQTNLIDAIVYDTSDADDNVLMGLLGVSVQINENENGNKTSESIQRDNSGGYFVGTPTPRQMNDGSGIVLNGVTITIAQPQYNEGEALDIVFTTDANVTSDLNLNITLSNGNFNTSDFTGNLSLTIPNGQNTVTTTITLIDDSDDEGDEILKVILQGLVEPIILSNNNVEIRIIDNDFVVALWGTPVNPTYGVVSSTQPTGYYDSLNGLSDAELKQALQDIIANPSIVRAQTYADVFDILKEADQNPENSNQVWLLYTEQGRPKLDLQTGSNSTGKWNREHTYPRSRGGFFDIDMDDIADGKAVFWTTNADSLRHGNSDAHALRATDGPENSSRGNKNYGSTQYDGPTGNIGSFKGDVARSVLYMAVRFNGLAIINGYPTTSPTGQLGDLTTLLEWHRNDPPDDFEMNRNNVVYTWQFNRNPFIDQPDLVEYIWGNNVGSNWLQPLNISTFNTLNVQIYPNPTSGVVYIKGIKEQAEVSVFSTQGIRLKKVIINKNTSLNFNLSSGIYFIEISAKNKSIVKKIIVQ